MTKLSPAFFVFFILLTGCEWINPDSSNSSLIDLWVSGTQLVPEFSPDRTDYVAELPSTATTATVSAVAAHSKATILVNGRFYEVGTSGIEVDLGSGTTEITIVVRSEDTDHVTTYRIVVNQAASVFLIGGSVSGLTGTVTLQNNGGDDLSVDANGPFAFATPQADGSAYDVSVSGQPAGQECTVSAGAGTVAGADVTSVVVTCTDLSYTVGGTVSGLAGSVTLQNNGGDDLVVNGNGAFTFASSLADGAAYDVTVASQPAGQVCNVSNGSGTIASADVTNVSVNCVVPTYTVGGSVSGLTGSVTLQNNGGDDLVVTGNGPFTFTTALADGAAYDVTVSSQPDGQVCSVSNGTGTIASAAVTSVSVSCVVPTYTVGGSVSGLAGSVTLQNNGGDDLVITGDGSFTFATLLADGATYSVTVSSQPDGQVCSVSNGTGTIASADVTNVSVSCIVPTYTVGGTLSGLTGAVTLQNNGGDDLTLTGNGLFTFATPLNDGAAYDVTVSSQPAGQTCTVSNGAGNISGADVTNIAVSCVSPTQADVYMNHIEAVTEISVLGDLDGDGDPDMVTLDGVWFNDGIGGYVDSGQNFLAAVSRRSLALADVDGDGDIDLLVGAAATADNTLWLNDGNGTFSDSGQSIAVSDNTVTMALGDIDGDGDLDLVNGNESQPDTVWLNDGNGNFSDSGQALGNSWTQSVALGDVDGDGDLDLIAAAGSVTTLWLNDNGLFTDSGQALSAGSTLSVALGDVDNDGDLDIVKGNTDFSGAPNSVWINNGSGAFTDSGQALGSERSESVTLGDADGDGDLDLVDAGSLTAESDTLWLNDGNGVFTLGQALGNNSVYSVVMSDVDGDLDLDLMMSLNFRGNVVWINNGNAVYTNGGQALGNRPTWSIALGDLNGDGSPDMVEANSSQADRVWMNDGAGNFIDSGQALGSQTGRDVALGDLDGDSDLDLVVANAAQPDTVWFNDGSGTFTDSGQALSDRNTRSLALGDLDGDGDLDLVAGNVNDPNTVWLNDGAGLLTDSGQALGNGFTVSVALGDLDGDSDLDLVVGDYDLNNGAFNTVWFNDGNGSFADSGQLLGPEATASIALGDVDGDGDLDLVEGNSGNAGRANTVWLNDGSGAFTDSGQALGNYSTRSIALGDVDNDGDLDIAEGNGGITGDTVWLNNGAGTFTDSGQALGFRQTQTVRLSDIDGDGDLDLPTCSPDTNSPNAIFLNQTIR